MDKELILQPLLQLALSGAILAAIGRWFHSVVSRAVAPSPEAKRNVDLNLAASSHEATAPASAGLFGRLHDRVQTLDSRELLMLSLVLGGMVFPTAIVVRSIWSLDQPSWLALLVSIGIIALAPACRWIVGIDDQLSELAIVCGIFAALAHIAAGVTEGILLAGADMNRLAWAMPAWPVLAGLVILWTVAVQRHTGRKIGTVALISPVAAVGGTAYAFELNSMIHGLFAVTAAAIATASWRYVYSMVSTKTVMEDVESTSLRRVNRPPD